MIIEKDSHRKYIGMKLFSGRGRLNKGVPSDWKTYCSSSAYLKQLIKEKGVDSFHFLILEQYYSIGSLRWAETWTQTILEVPSKNSEFFNRFIDKVAWKVIEPVTAGHKKRLNYYMKKYQYV